MPDWERPGREHIVTLAQEDTLRDTGLKIAEATGTSLETLKLLQGGRVVVPARAPDDRAVDAGLQPNSRVRLLASAAHDVAAVRSARDMPGLAGLEHESQRAAARRRTAGGADVTLPTGPYTFQRFQTWDGLPMDAFPSSVHALKLLHRLAADRGIVAIMAKHNWRVGTLSEMPPEGKVGISPVCLLGVNINAGQEISLRLRTDDLKGFRRYQKIRETLVHELTHMVWGDHDNNFKQLNSQLLREAAQLDWTAQPGRTAGGYAGLDEEDAGMLGPDVEPTAHRLGDKANPAPAIAAAAAAALRRSQQAQAAAAAQAATGSIVGMGHRDQQTEAAEQALTLMGSSAEASVDAAVLDMQQTGLQSSSQQAAAAPRLAQASTHSRQVAGRAQAAGPLQDDMQHDSSSSEQHRRPETAATRPDAVDSSPAEMGGQATGGSRIHGLHLPQGPRGSLQAAAQPDAVPRDPEDCGRPADGSTSAEQPDEDMVDNGDAQQRYQRVQQALAALLARAPTPQQQQLVLSSLQTILHNALSSGDPKHRRVRTRNPAFQSRLGQYPEAVEVMKMAGFTEEQEPEPALALRREDPGLIWLTLSAVKDSMVH